MSENAWSPLGIYAGMRILTSDVIGDPYEDWSDVRSRGRAARRRKQGHKQRIVTRYRADGRCVHHRGHNCVYMHPDDYARFLRLSGPSA